ncbi:glutathione S-transferase [uncultured Ruegeria sp.]|uniref:glutathione S-transferase n=1 Tax=uncultured Ruegeria sp. TaxID=259304 RepID=UPI002637E842|nr:glutathione S-transferase [uncultured Ruegeria sp.]
MAHHPILWTFRRCPYAMRARLALASSGVKVELREIRLRDKPQAFLQTSVSGTVPTLLLPEQVIDESLDIMIWALEQNDPQRLLDMPQEGWDLIEENDGPFKAALDHTKYATRYPDVDHALERRKAASYLISLDERLNGRSWLFGDCSTLADLALLPFVRQFAHIDRAWFDAQEWPNLIAWLDRFLASEVFIHVMIKYSPWTDGNAPLWFRG